MYFLNDDNNDDNNDNDIIDWIAVVVLTVSASYICG